MTISPQSVKELREKTGAGMMDCKTALVNCDGNFEHAIVWLREKGIATAKKKESRSANQGRVFTAVRNNQAIMLALNCETDFVATNTDFISFGEELVACLMDLSDVPTLDAIGAVSFKGQTVSDALSQLILKVGEKVSIAYLECARTGTQFVDYVHSNGKIGVILGFENSFDEALSKGFAMHVAAMDPQYITKEEVSESFIAKEREFLKKQALDEGKPEAIAEKMVEGRLNKSLSEICFVEQPFVKDPSQKIKTLLSGNKIVSLKRYQLG